MSHTARANYEQATDRPALDELIAGWVGSWPFMIVLTAILTAWTLANVAVWAWQWDPYPFVLMNLFLSFQAAYTAPVILMSSARGAAADRKRAIADYEINVRAEAGVAAMQEKLDAGLAELAALRTQVAELLGISLASRGGTA